MIFFINFQRLQLNLLLANQIGLSKWRPDVSTPFLVVVSTDSLLSLAFSYWFSGLTLSSNLRLIGLFVYFRNTDPFFEKNRQQTSLNVTQSIRYLILHARKKVLLIQKNYFSNLGCTLFFDKVFQILNYILDLIRNCFAMFITLSVIFLKNFVNENSVIFT